MEHRNQGKLLRGAVRLPRLTAGSLSSRTVVAAGAEASSRRTKLTLGTIVAAAALLIAVMWIVTTVSIRFENEADLERLRSEGHNLAIALAAEAKQVLDDVAANMGVVAERMRATPGRFDIYSWQRELPLLQSAAIEGLIIGPDGILSSTTVEPFPKSVDLSAWEAVQAPLDARGAGMFIGKPQPGPGSNATIQLSRRVESGDGKLVGIVVFAIAPSRLGNLPRLIDLGPRGAMSLIGSDGIIRARFTSEHRDGLFGIGRSASGGPLPEMNGRDEVSFTRASPIDQVERLVSYRRVAGYPLIVSVGLELAPALDPDSIIFLAVTSLATIAIAGIAAYLIFEIRRRTKKELELAEQRQELAAANNRLKVDVAMRREAEQRLQAAQDMLRDAVESISEAFVIYDADDRLAMCNEAFRNLYPESIELIDAGATYEDLVRHGLAVGRYAGQITRPEEFVADRLRAHNSPTQPLEMLYANGRWVLVAERRMRNGGIAGLRIDITRQKRTEAELRRARDNLVRAQRIARMGSDVRELSSEVADWSDETYRIMGVECGTFVPTLSNFLSLVAPADRPKVIASEEQLARRGRVEPFDFQICRPDGEFRMIRRDAELLYDDSGDPVAIAGTLHDVTELRAAEENRKELERQLLHSQKLESLGTLAAGIAHDINNTLTPIVVLSELMMAETPEGSRAREDLEVIMNAGRHSRDLVRSILAFSRKQDGGLSLIDLGATLRESAHMLRATLPTTVNIVEQIDDVPPLLGNAGQLQQVVVNLVNNAVQAIGERFGTVTIKLWHEDREVGDHDRRTGDSVCLRVTDTGHGMDRETMSRVFDPFFTTKPVGEGTGLGLSLVYNIVTGHGGRVAVNSQPGIGTEFTIYLPLRRIAASADMAAAA